MSKLLSTKLIATLIISLATCESVTDHSLLLQHHLRNLTQFLGATLLPVLNSSVKFEVTINFYPLVLLSVNGAEQTIRLRGFADIYWTDERLVWNPSDFGGESEAALSASEIWIPQIAAVNEVGEDLGMKLQSPNALLHSVNVSATRVMITVGKLFYSTCNFEFLYFPIDTHNCSLIMVAQRERQQQPEYVAAAVAAFNTNYSAALKENNQWTLTNFTCKTQISPMKFLTNSPPQMASAVVCTFTISRNSQYYACAVLLPLLLLSFLLLLQLCAPIQSGERLGMGISIFVSYTIFLLLIDQLIPKTKRTPLLLQFIANSMLLGAASISVSCLQARLRECGDTKEESLKHLLFWYFRRMSNKVSNDSSSVSQEDGKRRFWLLTAKSLELTFGLVGSSILAKMLASQLLPLYQRSAE